MERTEYHLGLIGYPLGHSLSPQLHLAALSSAQLKGEYRLFPIPPDETALVLMSALTSRMRRGALHGLNVTIPHKQNVMKLVDELSETAQAVGAVNTIYRTKDGRLAGDNTDVPGFLRDITRLLGGNSSGKALVLGAGGSARAVVYALGRNGWEVRVLARREEQAAQLIYEITQSFSGDCRLTFGQISDEILSKYGDCDLLVNTTPLGMYPKIQACPWPKDIPLPGQAAVYDLIYNPFETILVARARAEGRLAAGGAGMLISQAALAFQRWTGLDAPFDVMERAFFEPKPTQMGVD